MNYSIFKLSYIMYLQKKYYSVFKLGKENIYVLPPVLKRRGLSLSLAFPVAKRMGRNFVSRPIGVILVNKNAKERFYDMNEFEFTNFSQNFEKEYMYKTYEQEYLKATLNLLATCYPKLPFIMKKEYNQKYLLRVKNSFDERYWTFYQDLIANKFFSVSKAVVKKRTDLEKKKDITKKNVSKSNFFIKKEVFFELKNFVFDEIWNNFEKEKEFSKLIFLELIGEILRKKDAYEDKNKMLEQKKINVAKAYARSVNFLVEDEKSVNHLAEEIFVFLEGILTEEKNKVFDKIAAKKIKEACFILNNNLPKLKDERAKKLFTSYFNRLVKDYSSAEKKSVSHILFAYLFLFLD